MHAIFIAAKLYATTRRNNEFIQCLTSDINKHIITACIMFTQHRETFIRFVTNHVNPNIGILLRQIDLESLFIVCRSKAQFVSNVVETPADRVSRYAVN